MSAKATIWHSVVHAFTECFLDLLTRVKNAVQPNVCYLMDTMS